MLSSYFEQRRAMSSQSPGLTSPQNWNQYESSQDDDYGQNWPRYIAPLSFFEERARTGPYGLSRYCSWCRSFLFFYSLMWLNWDCSSCFFTLKEKLERLLNTNMWWKKKCKKSEENRIAWFISYLTETEKEQYVNLVICCFTALDVILSKHLILPRFIFLTK